MHGARYVRGVAHGRSVVAVHTCVDSCGDASRFDESSSMVTVLRVDGAAETVVLDESMWYHRVWVSNDDEVFAEACPWDKVATYATHSRVERVPTDPKSF